MGFVFDTISAGQQLQYQSYSANVSRQLAPLNRSFFDQAAASALDAGNVAAARAQMRGSQTIGAQIAGYAASGLDASSGSAMAAMADSRMMSELDAATLRNNAAREAWGYKVRGEQAFQQGMLDSQRQQNEATGTALSGFGKSMNDITSFGNTISGGGKFGLSGKQYG